ncbi:CMD domain-containing protein, partial [Escherichia coli]|nr:CMD domain-containing protein [Escherichia coli]
IRQLSTDDTFGPQVALLTARTNGSPTCFDAWLPHWQGEEEFASHLREGDQALHHWLQQHPQARSLVTAVQLLTRSPDRFSAAQLTPL